MSSPAVNGTASAVAGSSNGNASSALQEAMLERMMDRKLRMLDMEYEECLKATKGYNIEDYDQGPKDDDEEPVDPETAKAFGYAAFGGPGSLPIESDPAESEAWSDYQRSCAEEAADAAARGITNDDVLHQSDIHDPPPLPPQPLPADKIDLIKTVMKNVKLKPPMWAINVPEEVWMSQILERAGMRPRVSNTHSTAAPTAAASEADAFTAAVAANSGTKDADAAKRAKKKKQAKKRAKKAANAAAAAAAATTVVASSATDDDFIPVFPAAENGVAAANDVVAVSS